ncbi:MAG: hypothetical protein AAF125_00180, partial [Chloroflexota bacterium]
MRRPSTKVSINNIAELFSRPYPFLAHKIAVRIIETVRRVAIGIGDLGRVATIVILKLRDAASLIIDHAKRIRVVRVQRSHIENNNFRIEPVSRPSMLCFIVIGEEPNIRLVAGPVLIPTERMDIAYFVAGLGVVDPPKTELS